MENRFDHNPPEEQGWGNYVTPPGAAGRNSYRPGSQPLETALCQRVREMLPHLLENDGEIRPEMARQVYGHLSVCPGCAGEFDEMERVILLMDKMPPAEMPQDFSQIIMQRILSPDGPIPQRPPLRVPLNLADPQHTTAVVQTQDASARSTRAALGQPQFNDALAPVKVTPSVSAAQRATTQNTTQSVAQNVTQSVSVQTGTSMLSTFQRLTAASVLTAVMAFLMTTAWGRNALSSDLEALQAWIQQMGDALHRVPLFGRLTTYLFAAMTQMSSSVSETYRTLGATAAKGLTIDIALCACACFFLAVRKQRSQRIGI
jgi:hypothetical protein